MSVSEPPASISKPVRSRWRRIALLTGLFLLFGPGAFELFSLWGFSSTRAGLEQRMAVKGQSFLLNELPGKLHGYVIRSDSKSDGIHTISLRWPSLFQKNQLWLSVNAAQEIVMVDADSKPIGKAIARPANRGPLRGMPAGYEGVAALKTTEPFLQTQSSLVRELIRQSFLIAAQEGLGLPTLDPSVGQVIPDVESPQSLPFNLRISFLPTTDRTFVAEIHLESPDVNGKEFKWAAPELSGLRDDMIESLSKSLGELMAGPFVEAWQAAGFKKMAASDEEPAKAAETYEYRMDIVSQYAQLRHTHAQIRATGSTTEKLGKLVHAYANLGHLSENYWGPHSKVFKARALLYSRRMISQAGESPYTLSHWAYSLALTGRHAAAIELIDAARKAQGQKAPEWLELIDAYCRCQPEILQKSQGSIKELAQYLRIQLLDLTVDRERSIIEIAEFQRLHPTNSCALELLIASSSLGPLRMVTEQFYDDYWPLVCEQLSKTPGLPEDARQIAAQKPDARAGQLEQRAALIRALRQSVAQDRTAASWSILADLLSEEAFLQAWNTLHVQTTWLGVSADESMNELMPVNRDHRYGTLLECFSSHRQRAKACASAFVDSMDSSRSVLLEMPSIVLFQPIERLIGEGATAVVVTPTRQHRDFIYTDVDQSYDSEDEHRARALLKLSPHWILPISESIKHNWRETHNRAREWEQQHNDCPSILDALGSRYQQEQRPADAIRCFKKSVEIAPTMAGYVKLAHFYRAEGNAEKWQESLDQALKLPSFGLEDASVRAELAKGLMKQGKWEKAAPYAAAAAESYSAWGLTTAARCAEAMGEWKAAESYIRASSLRYRDEAPEWYFWCVRTEHGDRAEAKKLAERYQKAVANLQQPNRDQSWNLTVLHILSDDYGQAAKTLEHCYRIHRQPIDAVMSGLFADLDHKPDLAESMWRAIEGHLERFDPSNELAEQFLQILGGDAGKTWDHLAFEDAASFAPDLMMSYLYYAAGLFLRQHGQVDQGNEYLLCAATSYDVSSSACLLANVELRKQKIPIPASRLNVAPDSIAPWINLYREARRAKFNVHLDVADARIKTLLEQQPEFLPGLMSRAAMHELRGEFEAALTDYREVLRIHPDFERAQCRIALILAMCPENSVRDGKQALELAERIYSRRKIQNLETLLALAAAHAETGDFEKAFAFQDKAQGYPGLTDEERIRISMYQSRRPCRIRVMPIQELKLYSANTFLDE